MSDKLEPLNVKIINPKPYLSVSFGCTNRRFYQVKDEMYELGVANGLEPQDGYMTELCDYEGDLETIIVYRGGREEVFAKLVIEYYGLEDQPEDLNIHFTTYNN